MDEELNRLSSLLLLFYSGRIAFIILPFPLSSSSSSSSDCTVLRYAQSAFFLLCNRTVMFTFVFTFSHDHFKKHLITHFRMRNQAKEARDNYLTETYAVLMGQWSKKVDKVVRRQYY